MFDEAQLCSLPGGLSVPAVLHCITTRYVLFNYRKLPYAKIILVWLRNLVTMATLYCSFSVSVWAIVCRQYGQGTFGRNLIKRLSLVPMEKFVSLKVCSRLGGQRCSTDPVACIYIPKEKKIVFHHSVVWMNLFPEKGSAHCITSDQKKMVKQAKAKFNSALQCQISLKSPRYSWYGGK